jgi:hypothetical protein
VRALAGSDGPANEAEKRANQNVAVAGLRDIRLFIRNSTPNIPPSVCPQSTAIRRAAGESRKSIEGELRALRSGPSKNFNESAE